MLLLHCILICFLFRLLAQAYHLHTVYLTHELLFLYHAAFLKKRNPIAEDLIVVVLVLLRIHPIINLLQCRPLQIRNSEGASAVQPPTNAIHA